MKYTEILFFKLLIYCWPKYKSLAIFFLANTPYSLKKLKLEEYLRLDIISDGEIYVRSHAFHLDFVTDNGKNKKIGKIVDNLTSELYKLEFLNRIFETPTDKHFKHHDYPRRMFRSLGNNSFNDIVMFGFRRYVLRYKEVYQYIIAWIKPRKFINTYYLKLVEAIFDLKQYLPIMEEMKVGRNGRYSLNALIGRIVNKQSYIPLYKLYSNQ